MAKPTDFSLADFHLNDSPNVLEPPQDYLEWIEDPGIRSAFTFFEQQLLGPPKSRTEILSNIDSRRRPILNMTSYNYLGLSTHPEVIQAAHETLDEYGLGASGAPLLSGTFDLHVELARRLAEFKQKDDCMVFSSGYGGNLGALQGMMRKGDIIAMDERSHKSVVDGATLSGAKKLFFAHNDASDLAAQLEKHKDKRILVVLEGVYSMDGDLCRLPELTDVAESYGAGVYLDEAHSTLMFGENGRGVAEHFGMEDRVGVSYGTLSKSFGGIGGFICANERLISYLKGYSSAWNFSCSPAPPIVGGLLKSLEVATRDSSLRDKLWENTAYFRTQLETLGLDTGECESQVIPIIIGPSAEKLFKYASEMQQRGLFLQPIDYPAVPANKRRFRVSMSSQFEKEDLDRALNIIEDVIVADAN